MKAIFCGFFLPSSLKRTSGLGSVLQSLSKKPKISTLVGEGCSPMVWRGWMRHTLHTHTCRRSLDLTGWATRETKDWRRSCHNTRKMGMNALLLTGGPGQWGTLTSCMCAIDILVGFNTPRGCTYYQLAYRPSLLYLCMSLPYPQLPGETRVSSTNWHQTIWTGTRGAIKTIPKTKIILNLIYPCNKICYIITISGCVNGIQRICEEMMRSTLGHNCWMIYKSIKIQVLYIQQLGEQSLSGQTPVSQSHERWGPRVNKLWRQGKSSETVSAVKD